MKISRRRRGSIFSMLLSNYILFTVILVLGMAFLVVIGATRLGNIMGEANQTGDFMEYQEELAKGDYADLPIDWLVGTDGYIEIIDNNNVPVYQSNDLLPMESFTQEELACMFLCGEINESEIREMTGDDGRKIRVVTIIQYDEDDNEVKKEISMVLDDRLNVLFSTKKLPLQQMTKRQFQLLTDDWNGNYSVRKQPFLTEKGEAYTAVAFSVPPGDEDVYRAVRTMKEVSWEVFALYCLLIASFIFWLNRKINHPLRLLNTALLNFSKGEREQYVDYQGPKELVEICESFNHMAEELHQTEQENEKLEQEKRKILADISHDLKTPITVIKGYSKALCDHMVSEEEKDQYLTTIYQKADGLTELIDTFYEYSKMDHPDYSLSLEKQDVCTYLRNYLAETYNELYVAGMGLEVEIPEVPIFVKLDPFQLKRVLENVIGNVVKHNASGVTIFCTLEKRGNDVRILLADNGSGIPGELASKIFEPFVVGETSRTKHGSGLGLAVSRKIMEAHGGTMNLVNPPKAGYQTEFELILPLAERVGILYDKTKEKLDKDGVWED